MDCGYKVYCGSVCGGCNVHATRRHAMKPKTLILFAAVALLFVASAGQAQRARHGTVRSMEASLAQGGQHPDTAQITCAVTVAAVPIAPLPTCEIAVP